MLVKSNQYGAAYEFGYDDADAPQITGMAVRTAQLQYEPQVDERAMDGEGHTESRTVSKPEERRWTATFGGYITDPDTLPATADFQWNGRFWIVENGGDNRDKGKYADATVKASSDPGVTGPAH